MKYLVYSMDYYKTDKARFKTLADAIVFGNTQRQAGWDVVVIYKKTRGKVFGKMLDLEDVVC